jgi:hypothetical protein
MPVIYRNYTLPSGKRYTEKITGARAKRVTMLRAKAEAKRKEERTMGNFVKWLGKKFGPSEEKITQKWDKTAVEVSKISPKLKMETVAETKKATVDRYLKELSKEGKAIQELKNVPLDTKRKPSQYTSKKKTTTPKTRTLLSSLGEAEKAVQEYPLSYYKPKSANKYYVTGDGRKLFKKFIGTWGF